MELLVVIAVVALLTAILLPGLEHARDAAMDAVCRSRLRQHGVAHNAYKADAGGYYPVFGGPFQRPGGDVYVRSKSPWPDGVSTAIADTYFEQYATGDRAETEDCPFFTGETPGPWVPGNPNNFPGDRGRREQPGYCFLTGRKWYTKYYWNDYDTVQPTRDPNEILMTDTLFRNLPWHPYEEYSNGWVSGNQRPYFNPHHSMQSHAEKRGSANELLAQGAVVPVQYANTKGIRLEWERHHPTFAVHELVKRERSAHNGPYFAYPDE